MFELSAYPRDLCR